MEMSTKPILRLWSVFKVKNCNHRPLQVFAKAKESTWTSFKAHKVNLNCPFCGAHFPKEEILNWHVKKVHAKAVNNQIKDDNPLDFYKKIFGCENIKSVTNEYVRWPNGLIVTISGQFKGYWYNFKLGKGGGPVEAIMETQNIGIVKAIDLAASYSGADPAEDNLFEFANEEEVQRAKLAKLKRVEAAQELWHKSLPIENTLGQKYLVEHRKLPKDLLKHLTFRFLPIGIQYKDWNMSEENYEDKKVSLPAVLVPVEDSLGQILGIQRIFLHPKTGGKPAKKHKFSKGNLKGHPAVIYRGESPCDKVVIAEGPETAASAVLASDALATRIPVLASLSLGNLPSLANSIAKRWKPKVVILAADNDANVEDVEAINNFKSNLENIDIDLVVKRPTLPLKATKFDWNDVLAQKGLDELMKQFKR